MKQPLLPFCALLCLGLSCAGQSGDVRSKTPATKTEAVGNKTQATAQPAKSAPQQTPPPSTDPATAAQAAGAAPAQDPADPALKTPCGADTPEEIPAGAGKPYVIGPLDVLQISVWGSPNLSTFYDVGADGVISMHLIGQIKAAGETKAGLAKIIRGKLGTTVFECPPEVNVQVAKINSKKFFVYGDVGRPGEYPLVEDMTLMDAFANVGAFGPFANPKKIYVLRGDRKIPFNYNEVKNGKNMNQNIRIENGDRIFVP